MSSGFIPSSTSSNLNFRDEEWIKARAELDAARHRKEELSQQQQNGKSLYDVLQANRGDYLYFPFQQPSLSPFSRNYSKSEEQLISMYFIRTLLD